MCFTGRRGHRNLYNYDGLGVDWKCNRIGFFSVALCPDPVDIANGLVTFSGNSIGDIATYTCNSGFELIGGATTTCTQVDANSAAFQLAPPSCRREYLLNQYNYKVPGVNVWQFWVACVNHNS